MTASDTDLIRDSIVVETAVGWTPECLDEGPAMLERFHASGFSMLGLTIGADWDKTDPTMHHFARERARFEREPDRFKLAESVDDIHAAKAAGKLGIAFHFQGAGPLGYDPGLIAPFYRLGIRWMILAYNVRNPLGDGCLLPFPSDVHTVVDDSTGTHKRINLPSGQLVNVDGVPLDPAAWNLNDGWSPSTPILAFVPGLDPSQDEPETDGIYRTGVLANVLQLLKLPDGTVKGGVRYASGDPRGSQGNCHFFKVQSSTQASNRV